MLNVKVDLTSVAKYEKQLGKFAKTAVPFGVRNALNMMAFEGRKLWQGEMRSEFILRNTWTTRRILVVKASGLNVASMKSVIGSPDEYMEKQEHGGITLGSVPTKVASGEGEGAGPRRKLVRGPNKLSAIQLTARSRKGSRKRSNAAAVRMAVAAGKRFVFLQLGKSKGLFKLKGGGKRPQVRMVWNTTKKRHVVRARPTLGPAVKTIALRADRIMVDAMVQQLKRHKILGY
jgi:hypothetical protein